MKIGERIKEIRLSKNMTQQDLADALYVSQQTVAQYEKAESTTVGTLKRIAEVFNVPWMWLLDEDYARLEKALDKACGLLAENVTEMKSDFDGYALLEWVEPIRTKEEWKEYLLNEVNEDVD